MEYAQLKAIVQHFERIENTLTSITTTLKMKLELHESGIDILIYCTSWQKSK